MVEVTLPRGIFTRRFNEGSSRRKPVLELLAKTGINSHISKFKYDVTVFAENIDVRKVSSACSLCLPDSICQLDDEVMAFGIKNFFDKETKNPDKLFLTRYFSSLMYFWNQSETSAECGKCVHPSDILDDPELFEYAKVLLADIDPEKHEQYDMNKWNNLAHQLAKNICTSSIFGLNGTRMFLTITGWLLEKVLQRIFKGVCVHQGEIELLERAHATDLPIIYVPLNRSFMDSFIIHWALLSSGLRTPYFFSSKGLRSISKHFGGLGIPKTNSTIDDMAVRSSVMFSCLRNLVKKSCSLKLTLEPHRSRDGKPSTELYGCELLKIVYDSYKTKEIEDVQIVPVNVSYEILPEDCNKEKFTANTLWTVLKMFWRCMKHGLGTVRVDFGQPFTLREFQQSMAQNKKLMMCIESYKKSGYNCFESYRKTYPGSELCCNSEFGSASSLPSIYQDVDCIDLNDESDYLFLDALTLHSIYSAMSSATLMSTHLVSFLLLKRFRDGTTGDILVYEVKKLKKLLEKRGRDVGFTGDAAIAVLLALDLLGPETISVQNESGNCSSLEFLFIQPVLESQSLRRLNYYANAIMPIFAMEAVVAVALYAVIGNQLMVSKGFEVDVRVKDETLLLESKRVYEVFTSEFFLHPTCQTTDVVIRKTFDGLHDSNLLQFLMDETMQRSKRYYESEEYNDDDSEEEGTTALASNNAAGEYFFIPYEYKVVSSEESCEELAFLKNLLVPYLEIYGVIAFELMCLVSTDNEISELPENTLVEQILQKLKLTFSEADYGELLSKEIVKTSLMTFEEHTIIYYNIDKKTKVRSIGLDARFDSTEKVLEVSNNISRFITY